MTPSRSRPRGWLPLLLLASVLTAAAAAAAAVPDSADVSADGVLLPVDPDELLILEVHVERYLASRGLIGYRHGDEVLLPVGELAAVLEYAVHADPPRGTAEGWLGSEDQTFRLDAAGRRVVLAGRQESLLEPCLHIDDEDIYVTSGMLSRWWPIDLQTDLRGLRVVVRAREPLPLIARLQREAEWSRHQGRDRPPASFPRRQAAYRLASWPFLDATVAYHGDRRYRNWRGSLLSRGDLARLSVTGFLNYDQRADRPWTAWLRAGRTDREAGLLGPLAATRFEVGDVTGDALTLIGGSARGRGVSVSNRPLGSVTQFESIDVHGDAPPGWDVELYLNGALHDLQTVGGDGRFTFAAVPLRLGLNVIRTVQYGPNGQVRENVQSYNIRSGMWGSGRLHYSFASLQLGESILGSTSEISGSGGQGQWSHQLDLGYGLGKLTTIGLAAVRTEVDRQMRDHVQARLLQSLSGVFLQAVAVKDLDGGAAASLSAQALVKDQSLYLSHARYDDYFAREPAEQAVIDDRSEVRLTGNLRPQARQPSSYRLRWQGDRYHAGADGYRRDNIDLGLSANVNRLSLGHDLSLVRERGPQEEDALLGRWLVAGFLHGVRVRGDVDYALTGPDGVRSLGLGLNYMLHVDLTAQVSGRHSFLDRGSTSVLGNIDWHLRWVRLGLRLGYTEAGGTSFGLSATTSLAKAPAGGVQLSGKRLTQQGAAMVRAFVDRDGDGVYSSGDEPLPGIGFKRHQLWRDIRTDQEGRAFLPGIPANQFINVLVDLTTVDDPFLVPVHEGMTTVVHSGGVASLHFPFQYVGEVEGYVLLDPEVLRPLRNIGLELLDDQGRRVAEAVSEFDGNYLIQDVRPGRYRLRVVESTLRGRPFVAPEPQWVEIPPGGDYVHGPTLVLQDGRVDQTLAAGLAVGEDDAAASGSQGEVEGEVAAAPAVEAPAPGPVMPIPATPEEPARTVAAAEEASDTARGTEVAASPEPRDRAPAPASPPATEAMPEQAAAPEPRPARPASEPTEPSPELRRTLHLLHELLYESELFGR